MEKIKELDLSTDKSLIEFFVTTVKTFKEKKAEALDKYNYYSELYSPALTDYNNKKNKESMERWKKQLDDYNKVIEKIKPDIDALVLKLNENIKYIEDVIDNLSSALKTFKTIEVGVLIHDEVIRNLKNLKSSAEDLKDVYKYFTESLDI